MLSKNIFKLSILAMFGFLASCVSHGSVSGFELIDSDDGVCVFDLGPGVYRRAYIGRECINVDMNDSESIVIEDGVSISAAEIASALKYLDSFAEKQCRSSQGREYDICLKGQVPDRVSRSGQCLVFWYGRNSGVGGFPVGVVRNEEGFSSPRSHCDSP